MPVGFNSFKIMLASFPLEAESLRARAGEKMLRRLEGLFGWFELFLVCLLLASVIFILVLLSWAVLTGLNGFETWPV